MLVFVIDPQRQATMRKFDEQPSEKRTSSATPAGFAFQAPAPTSHGARLVPTRSPNH
jgi:hypothetical protein